jgi:hypothetical protein
MSIHSGKAARAFSPDSAVAVAGRPGRAVWLAGLDVFIISSVTEETF